MRGAAWAPFAETLNLHPELSALLARTTNGNPLFAQQLVSDWVQQGVLSAGNMGFELAASGGQLMPTDLAALWRQRLERVLQGLAPTDAEALSWPLPWARRWTRPNGLMPVSVRTASPPTS